jgi:hypothetical protein
LRERTDLDFLGRCKFEEQETLVAEKTHTDWKTEALSSFRTVGPS